jgi:hypothetical protein
MRIKEERGKSRQGAKGKSDVDGIISEKGLSLALWRKGCTLLVHYMLCYKISY